jgi:hypothetical protein
VTATAAPAAIGMTRAPVRRFGAVLRAGDLRAGAVAAARTEALGFVAAPFVLRIGDAPALAFAFFVAERPEPPGRGRSRGRFFGSGGAATLPFGGAGAAPAWDDERRAGARVRLYLGRPGRDGATGQQLGLGLVTADADRQLRRADASGRLRG